MAVNSNDSISVVARLSFGGVGAIQNRYTIYMEGAGCTDVEAAADIGSYLEDIYDGLVPYMWDSLQFTDFTWRNVTQDGAEHVEEWPSLTAGAVGSDPVASGVAFVVSAYTLYAKVRGRKFWGIFTEGNKDALYWASALLAAGAVAAASYITGFTGSSSGEDWTPGVLRGGTVFTPFSEVLVRATPGYQRRRKVGVGI